MIQDGEGTLVRLSKEGTAGFRGPEIPLYNYSPPEIQPGRALKFDVPLRKYFAINRKGRYKVLAGAEREIISGEVKRPLKATQVTLLQPIMN